MLRKTLTLTLVLLLLTAGAVLAAPTFDGPTGLFSVPTSEVVDKGDFAFGANYLSFGDSSRVAGIANCGVMDRLEAGLTYINPDGSDSFLLINAKYQLLKPTAATPGVALGVSNLTDSEDLGLTFYGVATQSIPFARATLTAGLAIEGSDSRLIAGAAFPAFPFTQAIVEQNENINLGLRFRPPLLPLNVDVVLFDVLDERDFGLAAGYSLSF